MIKILIVTGGIACGKSTMLQYLLRFGGKHLAFFDCDAEVTRLKKGHRLVNPLREAFGDQVLNQEGMVDNDALRKLVFNDEEQRKRLELLIHPILQQECLAKIAEARQNPDLRGFIIDIPLFYEGTVDYGHDAVCVVAVSVQTQKIRLAQRNGFDANLINSILSAQLPIESKIRRADVVIWNEGSESILKAQTERFYRHFFMNEDEQEIYLPSDEGTTPAKAPQNKNTEQDVVQAHETYNINELRCLPLCELQALATPFNIRNMGSLTKSQLIFDLGRCLLKAGHELIAEGVMEQAKDNYAMLRDPAKSFKTSPDDIYLAGDLIRNYDLRVGHLVKVRLRPLRPHDKYLSTAEILSVEGVPVEEFRSGTEFEKLTPLFPKERLILENKQLGYSATRVIDLVTPFGKGQRGLIVAPPRGGKTILLKMIAKSLKANYQDIELIILLLDERPEEVTDFEETVNAPVYSSTFDEPSRRHAQVSDLVIERAKRLVEQGRDVVILLDSLTRLARGHNANQSGGRIMSGGLGSNAMEKPRKFFGAARNVEEGGSLTILATCLVDTESRMDEVIFEEFKGTGNMEIRLDRELAERRIFPAISLNQSGTRNDDKLYNEQEFQKILQLRRQLANLPTWEALESLLKNIAKTQNNAELELLGLR
ncbi:MAG: transcription termination factor Rho [Akkermansia sp.]